MTDRDDRFSCVHDADELGEGPFREIYECWDAARGDADVPPVSRLRPVAFPPHLLPNMSILGIEPDGEIVVRLAGSAVSAATGLEITDQRLDAPARSARRGAFLREAQARVRWCVETRKPYCACGHTVWAARARDHLAHRMIGLPYADEHGRIARILYYLEFGIGDRDLGIDEMKAVRNGCTQPAAGRCAGICAAG